LFTSVSVTPSFRMKIKRQGIRSPYRLQIL